MPRTGRSKVELVLTTDEHERLGRYRSLEGLDHLPSACHGESLTPIAGRKSRNPRVEEGLTVTLIENRHYEFAPGKKEFTRAHVRMCNEPNTRRHGFRMTGPWEVIAGTTNALH